MFKVPFGTVNIPQRPANVKSMCGKHRVLTLDQIAERNYSLTLLFPSALLSILASFSSLY